MKENPRDLRRRIRSLKSTVQITRAMQMISAAKMRKAQQSALCGVRYAELLNDVLSQIGHYVGNYHHPLMKRAAGDGMRAVILVGPDRGLCGPLNSILSREILPYNPETTIFIAVGRKGVQFLQRTRRMMLVEFPYGDAPKLSEARTISRFVCNLFLDGEVDAVDIVFNSFISTLRSKPVRWRFLPVGQEQDVVTGSAGTLSQTRFSLEHAITDSGPVDFEFEPDVQAVYESLVLRTLDYQLLQIMRESRASEHSARMIAMKAATDNANEMIRVMSLKYNKFRQAVITRELLEISSAIAADR